jgi:hypothetical protein
MGGPAKLCEIVEGVQFTVLEQGITIRALILRDALEEFFGADDSPQSWLEAYLAHRDTIDCAAADRYRRERGTTLTVLRAERPDDFKFPARAGAA